MSWVVPYSGARRVDGCSPRTRGGGWHCAPPTSAGGLVAWSAQPKWGGVDTQRAARWQPAFSQATGLPFLGKLNDAQ
eukprot:1158812-Pelagomonas_calceolata.AAC.8